MKKLLLLLSVVCFVSYSFSQSPTITSFTPLSGPVGTIVTITGTNFSTTPSANIVYVGGMKAVVNSPATATSLNIVVPPGITLAPITVTVAGLTANSTKSFITTFPGGGITLASTSFGIQTPFATPSGYAASTVAGDLNNDGKADIVTANYTSNTGTTISVFTNNSDKQISLTSRLDITTATGPYALVLFDVDGDGKLDVAVNNYGNGKLSVLRNTTTGATISFAPKVDITIGSIGSTALVTADFDLDGKPDLAYPDFSTSNQIAVLRNTTSGTSISFTKTNYTSGTSTFYLSSGDYDGDGKVDISMVNFGDPSPTTSWVSVLRNTSTGSGVISFAPKVDFTTEIGPRQIASADLDGDGKLDLGIVNDNFGAYTTISVFRNTSTAGTVQFAAKQDIEVNSTANNISFNDMDGDGKVDILLAQSFYGILRNTSTSGSISFAPKVSFTSPSSAITLGSADLNNDGRPDLIATSATTQLVVGKNQINEPVITSFSPVKAGTGDNVVVSGVNMDKVTAVNVGGIPAGSFTIISPTSLQITIGNGSSGNIDLVSPAGTGTKSGFTYYNGPTLGGFVPDSGPVGSTVRILGTHLGANLEDNRVRFGSTLAEVVSVSSGELVVKVPKGSMYQPMTVTANQLTGVNASPFKVTNKTTGSSTLSASSFAPKVDVPLESNPQTFVVGDFDDDGKSDIAVIQTSTVAVFRNTGVPGTFSFAAKVDLITGSIPISIATADFDNDGKLDLAVANSGSASVSVFKNTSGGGNVSFGAKVDFTVGTNPQFITTGDLNGDGKPDMATANFTGSNYVSVLLNTTTSGISFGTKTDYTAGSFPTCVAIADVTYDGKADLLVTNGVGNTLSVFKNTSTGETLTFGLPQAYTVGSFPVGIAVGYLSNQNYPDILIANSTSSSTSLFNTATTTVNPTPLTTGNSPSMIALGDLNGDGGVDLVSANNGASSVSVIQNQGGSTFGSKVDLTTGGSPAAIAVVDLDSDGAPDIITSNNSSSSFSILRNTIPSLSSFSPTSGSPGTKITINGSNLSGATAVSFGGTAAASFTVISSTTLEAIVARGTTGQVVVTTPSGTLSLTGFTYVSVDPVLQSFSPSSGTKGTKIVLTGVNLNTVTSVKFGGTEAASFEIVSPSTINAIVGEGSGGFVTVSTIDGYASTRSGFVYVPSPSIQSFTPTTATTGRTITITGLNLSGVTGVSFGEVAAASFTINSPTSISAVVGAGASGKVTLTFALGTVSLDGFTYEMVTGIEPALTQEVDVFPNPFNGKEVNLHLPQMWHGQQALIEIHDLTGRSLSHHQVVCQSVVSVSIDKSGALPTGLYLLNIQVGSKKVIKKVMVK